MACALPHTDSEIEALVQRLINEDKGRQDVLLNLAFQFEDSCAVRDDLRKAYEKCNDISQESRALICTLLKESSEKDRKLHLSMYGKAAQLEKQMDAKSAWFQEKYSGRTHGGIGCSSSQTNCPLTEKELHQLRMDEEAQKGMLEEEAMNKKAQEEKIRQEQAENDAFFLEFGVVRYDSECQLINLHLHTQPKSLLNLYFTYQSSCLPHRSDSYNSNQSINNLFQLLITSNEYQSTAFIHNVFFFTTSIPQVEYAPTTYQQQQPKFSQPDSGLVVPVFQKGDDPIDAINHMMSFLTAVGRQTTYAAWNNEINTPLVHSEATRGNITIALMRIFPGNAQMHSLRYKGEVKDLKEMQNVENSFSGSNEQYAEIVHLKETLSEQVQERISGTRFGHSSPKNELRKLKGKALDKEATENHSVDPKVSKDNMEPITPKLLNKKTAHSSYIKHTQEEALVLRNIVEHVKANYPHDSLLESAFRYTKVIQDLLSHISRSCPSINKFGPQLVEATPRKKDKKVSASGSQPSGNTRNDRISQTPSSNSKNKVEAHPRNVKSSLTKRNGTVKVNGSANDCMSSDNLCVSNSMNDVKSRAKPKKNKSKKDIWKPTGKVFTQI
ncbi:hypothetical protein Tco_0195426 [Tanacetum coccineum]